MKYFRWLALALLFFAADAKAATSISGSATNRSTVNASVVVTTGGTFQTILPSIQGTSTQRQALTIQNNNASDNCWIIFGGGITAGNATAAKSILLAAGQGYSRFFPYVPSDEIEATCTTTSDTLYVDTQ
jgi:hypothetical protein